ncbi:hypothetical protein D3C77_406780 [compost metagenome]
MEPAFLQPQVRIVQLAVPLTVALFVPAHRFLDIALILALLQISLIPAEISKRRLTHPGLDWRPAHRGLHESNGHLVLIKQFLGTKKSRRAKIQHLLRGCRDPPPSR